MRGNGNGANEVLKRKENEMKARNYNLFVRVKHKIIPEYTSHGKTYVEGRPGSVYEIGFQNNTYTRKKVVFSVDGLNVMSGDSVWERGYIVDPWETIWIPGWRINSDKIASFEFSRVKDSYNEHNDAGAKKNIGVIGAMVFEELPAYKQPITQVHHYYNHWHYPLQYTFTGGNDPLSSWGNLGISRSSSLTERHAVNCMATPDFAESTRSVAKAESASVGTAWGEEKQFETTNVTFQAKEKPETTLLLYYHSKETLQRMGIDLRKDRRDYREEPEAFPGFQDGCPYPK